MKYWIRADFFVSASDPAQRTQNRGVYAIHVDSTGPASRHDADAAITGKDF